MIRARLAVLLLFAMSICSLAPAGSQHLRVPGVTGAVEIIKDRWGISHIYAANETDLFFAQGYNAARDRLFQLEIWRRQATGTAAEILGRKHLKRDLGARLHKFRGDLKQELNFYHPRGETIIRAFVGGINAYVEETERSPALLPLEFRLLGIKPGRWSPEVVISRHQGLLGNVTQELNYGRAVALLGPDKVKELSWFRPGDPVLALDPAIDGSLLSDNILELYNAFREAIRFEPENIVSRYRGNPASFDLLARALPVESRMAADEEYLGSNNWVVGGKRTLTGFPIMANDPHRVLQAPSLRYWVHLVAPGWNVIGGGEPSVPGISIGHNEHGAWGFTIFGQDSEDLYVYDTNPANPLQYKYKGSWEEMKVIKDSIPVRGESPISVELKYTRHGPVLYEDREHHKAYALRAAWLEIGSAPYLASLRMDQAKDWEEFRSACSYARIPAENMVWADADKNIGYQATGISPIRRNFSGLVPVPGDGRYEWDGFLPILALPHTVNPEKGYFATANNYLVPDGYPFREALHYTWGDEMRAVRIEEILRSGRMQTVPDMMRLQQDELSVPARSLAPLLKELSVDDPAAAKARQMLLSWDYVLDKDSVAAAVYVSWERRLQENVRALLVPESARRLLGGLNLKRMIDWLCAPDGRFGSDPIAGRDALLNRSLIEAVADLKGRLGPDMSQWQYGQAKFKHVLLHHPLSAAVSTEVRFKLDVGPLPRGGYAATVNSTGPGDNQTTGASFRIIADTENWDNSVGTNTPGQSGNPDSPHYRDLFDLWARGRYFPVFFSRAKVESVEEDKLILEPK
ncbi:MAG TPA: penicillin acylase family protein [Acidobacteriota bacterium]|nr:penicillin acylase family protein [Acidobacteriota bacterium]